MPEVDALSDAKFGNSLFLSDFPARIRVLTRDPLVYNDNFANTKYAFVVFNVDETKVQVLDKGPGFPKRFQEINADVDFGGDLRMIDLKVTTNGLSGKEIRYTITPVGAPTALTEAQKRVILESKLDLDAVVKKNNPGAIRLSEVNAGRRPEASMADTPLELEMPPDDVIIENIGDEPINLDDIPF